MGNPTTGSLFPKKTTQLKLEQTAGTETTRVRPSPHLLRVTKASLARARQASHTQACGKPRSLRAPCSRPAHVSVQLQGSQKCPYAQLHVLLSASGMDVYARGKQADTRNTFTKGGRSCRGLCLLGGWCLVVGSKLLLTKPRAPWTRRTAAPTSPDELCTLHPPEVLRK